MADGKWISGLAADTPLDVAARRVLSLRLGVVSEDLDRVLDAPDGDPEDIHQLRVGTRRAAAALAIFADCLSAAELKGARKQLRRIRRAAGQVRDWDVFLASLWDHPRTPPTGPGLDYLIGYATARSDAARALLQAEGPDLLRAARRCATTTVDAVDTPRSGLSTMADLARAHLCDLLNELDREARCDLDDYENLHQVRIVGKRLRYAMEVFAVCFAPPFREKLYPVIAEMQEILGRANDSFVAGQRLAVLRDALREARPDEWARCQPGIEELWHESERRLPQQRDQFLRWWDLWQQTGGSATASARLEDLQIVAPRPSTAALIIPDRRTG